MLSSRADPAPRARARDFRSLSTFFYFGSGGLVILTWRLQKGSPHHRCSGRLSFRQSSSHRKDPSVTLTERPVLKLIATPASDGRHGGQICASSFARSKSNDIANSLLSPWAQTTIIMVSSPSTTCASSFRATALFVFFSHMHAGVGARTSLRPEPWRRID